MKNSEVIKALQDAKHFRNWKYYTISECSINVYLLTSWCRQQCNNRPRGGGPRKQLSKRQFSKKTVLQGDYYPRRFVPWRTVSLDIHPLDNCCTTPGARNTEICRGERNKQKEEMNFFFNVNTVPGAQKATHFIESGKFCSFFATLGSILNSQLS